MRLSWLVLLGVAACSPYSYPKEVASFSSGVDQLSNGFAVGYASLAADHATQTQRDLVEARTKVAIAPSCGVAPGSLPQSQLPCALYRFGDTMPAASGIEQTRQRTNVVLAVLRNYAHALAAVTNAADRAAYDAAVAQLSGAVGALAKTADAAAPGAGLVAPAMVNFVGWVFGTALDQQRFASLKDAVNAVGAPGPDGKNPIHVVTATLGIGLVALSDARREMLYGEVNLLVAQLGPSLNDAAYRQRLGDAQATIAALDGLRRADPAGAAKGLERAHDALVAAVNDPGRNYPDLLQAIGDFSDKAAALNAAFIAAATPKGPVAKKGT